MSERQYHPRVWGTFVDRKRPGDMVYKTDAVYHVDKRDTWRTISVCSCVRDESWYPQISDLYACLNQHRGDITQCELQQRAFDKAFLDDLKVQVGRKCVLFSRFCFVSHAETQKASVKNGSAPPQ